MKQELSSTSIQIGKQLKDDADNVFNKIGIPWATAINLFLRQVYIQEKIPFVPTFEPFVQNNEELYKSTIQTPKEIKPKTTTIIKSSGLTVSSAIAFFLQEVVLQEKIPFELTAKKL